MHEPWRVGHSVPIDVYVGDTDVYIGDTFAGRFRYTTWARMAVEAVNERDALLAEVARLEAEGLRLQALIDTIPRCECP